MELLSPAGSREAVTAAVQSGAGAVYLGFGNYNARRNAKNFTREQLLETIQYCHVRGVKVYVTLNTLLSDGELAGAAREAAFASEAGADAVLVQDLGVLELVRNTVPDLPIHASTQMSLMNLDGVKRAADPGRCWPGNCPAARSAISAPIPPLRSKSLSTAPSACAIPVSAFSPPSSAPAAAIGGSAPSPAG